jgi:thiamine-monophosphate kinase
MTEFEWIATLRGVTAPGVLVGIGDDCAVLAPSARPWLVTTDMLTECVDFLLAEAGPIAIGRKAMAVNLSDIAAMAGVPRFALVSLCLPQNDGRTIADGVMRGLREVAEQFGVAIIGGDTNSWSGGLVVSVTILGEATERGPVRRSGAKLGDDVYVTGPVGGSLLGRHLTPTPRIELAQRLHATIDLHSMIDISDGLAQDLGHILEESQCGANLELTRVPIHEDAVRRAALTGRRPIDHALNDGEDF